MSVRYLTFPNLVSFVIMTLYSAAIHSPQQMKIYLKTNALFDGEGALSSSDLP